MVSIVSNKKSFLNSNEMSKIIKFADMKINFLQQNRDFELAFLVCLNHCTVWYYLLRQHTVGKNTIFLLLSNLETWF